jgi:hypothetical protein
LLSSDAANFCGFRGRAADAHIRMPAQGQDCCCHVAQEYSPRRSPDDRDAAIARPRSEILPTSVHPADGRAFEELPAFGGIASVQGISESMRQAVVAGSRSRLGGGDHVVRVPSRRGEQSPSGVASVTELHKILAWPASFSPARRAFVCEVPSYLRASARGLGADWLVQEQRVGKKVA